MSPQIATVQPGDLPLVRADGRAVEQRLGRVLVRAVARVDDRGAERASASISAAPAWACRTTTTSGAIASRLRAVSSSVSPLMVDDAEPEMFTASADRRLAAISNEVRVRVDGSRNRLMTVFPRSVGTFLIGRCVDLQEALAEVEDGLDVGRRQRLDAEQVTVAERAHAGRSRSTTRSGSPRSASITRTDSRGVVCTARPTKSGWMGSSRRPRSISAASLTARGRP